MVDFLLHEKMKPVLKIFFTDFWRGFNPEENFFINSLRESFSVEIDPVNPDVLFYSYPGTQFLKYKCNRVFYTGENIRPHLFDSDYALCFDFSDDKRIIRLPHYVLYPGFDDLLLPKDIDKIVEQKTKFCSFVVSNKFASKRIEFFKKLSKYKKVDSGGKHLNNIGYGIQDKYEFLKPYKFNIAFENISFPGYTTEKVMQPMVVNTIPVYWGNPLVNKDFNTNSFINWHDYGNDDDVIEKIIEIDTNETLYRQMLAQPWLVDNKPNPYNDLNVIKQNINSIIYDARTNSPVAINPGKQIQSYLYNYFICPLSQNLLKLKRKIFGY
jgi:alpha(1,3/1,4) fucosyltransferase